MMQILERSVVSPVPPLLQPTPQLVPTIIQLREITIRSVNPTKQLDLRI